MRGRFITPPSIHCVRALKVLLSFAGLLFFWHIGSQPLRAFAWGEADGGTVMGVVFFDINADGLLQQGEGFTNIPVVITDSAGLVYTVTTGADGTYIATNLASGPALIDIQDSALPCGDKGSPNSALAEGVLSRTLPTCAELVQHIGTDPSPIDLVAGSMVDAGRDGYRRPQPVLNVDMSNATGDATGRGQHLVYMLVVSNSGEHAALDLTIVDPLPPGVTFVEASHGMAPNAANVVVWPVGVLDAGVSFAMSLTVRVSETTPVVTNVITVSAAGLPDIHRQQTTLVRVPVAITLATLSAKAADNRVAIHWRTATERNSFGFTIWRSRTGQRANAVNITPEVILAIGAGDYSMSDGGGVLGDTYWLQEVQLDGTTLDYGPVQAVGAPPATATPMAAAGGVAVAQTATHIAPLMEQQRTAAIAPSPANAPAAPAVIAPQPVVFVMQTATPRPLPTVLETRAAATLNAPLAPTNAPSTLHATPEPTPHSSMNRDSAKPVVSGAQRAVVVSRGARAAPASRLNTTRQDEPPMSLLPLVLMALGVLVVVGVAQRKS